MLKKLSLAFILIAFAAGSVLAAANMTGKVTSIDGKKVQIELVGEKAAWVKKGANLKFKGGVGRIVEISGTTLTFNSKSSDKLKVGDEIVVEKGPSNMAGC